ncbi:MAG: ABC transporter permease subunit [Nitrososphaeria archaeon]
MDESPNGLIVFRGEYHAFYQHNLSGAFAGTRHWGYDISRGLLRWKHLPTALDVTGVRVDKVRPFAVIFGGALCGLDGAFMSVGWFGSAVKEIFAGIGFIALAYVVFPGLEPLLAGIEGIPREYTEAAVVDGASLFQIFRRINLPLISAPLVTILMFRVLDGLKIFEIPSILMGGGGPGIVTETLTIYIYKVEFRAFYLGQAAAMSLIFMVIISIVSAIFISRVRKYYV